ncbi:MAG: hypothetical protein ACJ779_04230, partial [Chloroflexota bacterium]
PRPSVVYARLAEVRWIVGVVDNPLPQRRMSGDPLVVVADATGDRLGLPFGPVPHVGARLVGSGQRIA